MGEFFEEIIGEIMSDIMQRLINNKYVVAIIVGLVASGLMAFFTYRFFNSSKKLGFKIAVLLIEYALCICVGCGALILVFLNEHLGNILVTSGVAGGIVFFIIMLCLPKSIAESQEIQNTENSNQDESK